MELNLQPHSPVFRNGLVGLTIPGLYRLVFLVYSPALRWSGIPTLSHLSSLNSASIVPHYEWQKTLLSLRICQGFESSAPETGDKNQMYLLYTRGCETNETRQQIQKCFSCAKDKNSVAGGRLSKQIGPPVPQYRCHREHLLNYGLFPSPATLHSCVWPPDQFS